MNKCIEVWRPVIEYEGRYEVSNYGRVRSIPRKYTKGGILSKFVDKKNYVRVILSIDGKYKNPFVQCLVARAFLPNPNNFPIVNHKDENPSNNFVWVNPDGTVDPEKSNLEWCDYSYNLRYGGAIDRMISTRNKNNSYGSEKPVNKYSMEGEFICTYRSQGEAARDLGKNSSAICMALKGKKNSAYGYKWEYTGA